MGNISTDQLLIIGCSLVVLSYFFSIASRYVRVPSVLLLLFAGVGFRYIADINDFPVVIPTYMVEALGVVGLIMIVLEAGLDLKLTRKKLPLISSSFFSALIILLISSAGLTAILYYWLQEPIEKCIVYAIPLSVMSSSIVLPSIHALTESKKEFLVYEASFSDILGILVFNYFIAKDVLTLKSFGLFSGGIIISIIFSLVLSLVLFIILTRTKLNIKFFLIFSLLILIYAGGKIFHLPSLIIILVFGLMINNWEQMPVKKLVTYFPTHELEPIRHLLHSITAETSFLIRTFFFLLFGYSIQVSLLAQQEVLMVGGLIIIALFIVRFLYLRFFVHTNIFPEVFFNPRGLITIVLFYKIPDNLRLASFNYGILFFVILATGVIMTLGMIFYKKGQEEVLEEHQFSERNDIL